MKPGVLLQLTCTHLLVVGRLGGLRALWGCLGTPEHHIPRPHTGPPVPLAEGR